MRNFFCSVWERFLLFINSGYRFNAFMRIATLLVAVAVSVLFMFFMASNRITSLVVLPWLTVAWFSAGKMFELTPGIMRDEDDPAACGCVVTHSSFISLCLLMVVVIIMLVA